MFSIYDILQEADGDENQTNDAPAANNVDNNAIQNNDQNNNQQGDTNPAGNDNADDDFNMDMSLEDGDDDNATDTGDTDTSTDTMGDTTGDNSEEPVDANTDMFTSLSAEEQMMKITELKNQYIQLYDSCDDLIEKISNIENTESTVAPLSKLVNTLTDLKKYIIDYLYVQFDSKSNYENDVQLNLFLSIFYSISEVLKDIYKINIQND